MYRTIKLYKLHLISLTSFLVISGILYVYFPTLVASNLYFAAVTFLVGLSAFYLYTRQRIDGKKEIANIIISEIRHAENRIGQYKSSHTIQRSFYLEPILPSNSWTKNHHLFIQDLDSDEYTLVRNFFTKCELLDRALSQLSSSAQLEQKSHALYFGLMQIAKDLVQNITAPIDDATRDSLVRLFKIRTAEFNNIYSTDGTTFNPNAPVEKVVQILSEINFVTTSTAGEKLKRIAGLDT